MSSQDAVNTRAAPDCLICGAPGKLAHENLQDRLFGAPGIWSSRRCSNRTCQACWLDPQPIPSEIWKLYGSYWTHGGDEPQAPDAQLSSPAKRRAKKILSHLLFWRSAALLSDSRYLAGRKPGRLLDVGCGSGEFLAGMAVLGWEAFGTDFDEQAIAAAKRHRSVQVACGSLAQQQFADDWFDAITLSNVIEHVPDPQDTFRELARILKPSGRLVIVTPNANSLGHRAFGRCWRGLEPPRHLVLFTEKALRSLASKSGLRFEACFSAPGASSGILEASKELWEKSFRGTKTPSVRRLYRTEQALTLLNRPVGEFAVLVATK
jgi:2-polyprenyl-3-methyl-5-hydroxy-6-metoxy-1,4-benzoquinol methylase